MDKQSHLGHMSEPVEVSWSCLPPKASVRAPPFGAASKAGRRAWYEANRESAILRNPSVETGACQQNQSAFHHLRMQPTRLRRTRRPGSRWSVFQAQQEVSLASPITAISQNRAKVPPARAAGSAELGHGYAQLGHLFRILSIPAAQARENHPKIIQSGGST